TVGQKRSGLDAARFRFSKRHGATFFSCPHERRLDRGADIQQRGEESMILTALNNYYHRLQEKNPDSIPAFGFSRVGISYALVLSPKGELVDIRDIRDTNGKKLKPVSKMMPKNGDRSGSKAPPFFLWDNA